MRTNKKSNFEPIKNVAPDASKMLWCPFCDTWKMADKSHTARKRLGQHIADEHNVEVAFPMGEKPPELE